jgi:hypothetical protein
MIYVCPLCTRWGMAWEARAKILLCHYRNCNYTIEVQFKGKIPTRDEIKRALRSDIFNTKKYCWIKRFPVEILNSEEMYMEMPCSDHDHN